MFPVSRFSCVHAQLSFQLHGYCVQSCICITVYICAGLDAAELAGATMHRLDALSQGTDSHRTPTASAAREQREKPTLGPTPSRDETGESTSYMLPTAIPVATDRALLPTTNIGAPCIAGPQATCSSPPESPEEHAVEECMDAMHGTPSTTLAASTSELLTVLHRQGSLIHGPHASGNSSTFTKDVSEEVSSSIMSDLPTVRHVFHRSEMAIVPDDDVEGDKDSESDSDDEAEADVKVLEASPTSADSSKESNTENVTHCEEEVTKQNSPLEQAQEAQGQHVVKQASTVEDPDTGRVESVHEHDASGEGGEGKNQHNQQEPSTQGATELIQQSGDSNSNSLGLSSHIETAFADGRKLPKIRTSGCAASVEIQERSVVRRSGGSTAGDEQLVKQHAIAGAITAITAAAVAASAAVAGTAPKALPAAAAQQGAAPPAADAAPAAAAAAAQQTTLSQRQDGAALQEPPSRASSHHQVPALRLPGTALAPVDMSSPSVATGAPQADTDSAPATKIASVYQTPRSMTTQDDSAAAPLDTDACMEDRSGMSAAEAVAAAVEAEMAPINKSPTALAEYTAAAQDSRRKLKQYSSGRVAATVAAYEAFLSSDSGGSSSLVCAAPDDVMVAPLDTAQADIVALPPVQKNAESPLRTLPNLNSAVSPREKMHAVHAWANSNGRVSGVNVTVNANASLMYEAQTSGAPAAARVHNHGEHACVGAERGVATGAAVGTAVAAAGAAAAAAAAATAGAPARAGVGAFDSMRHRARTYSAGDWNWGWGRSWSGSLRSPAATPPEGGQGGTAATATSRGDNAIGTESMGAMLAGPRRYQAQRQTSSARASSVRPRSVHYSAHDFSSTCVHGALKFVNTLATTPSDGSVGVATRANSRITKSSSRQPSGTKILEASELLEHYTETPAEPAFSSNNHELHASIRRQDSATAPLGHRNDHDDTAIAMHAPHAHEDWMNEIQRLPPSALVPQRPHACAKCAANAWPACMCSPQASTRLQHAQHVHGRRSTHSASSTPQRAARSSRDQLHRQRHRSAFTTSAADVATGGSRGAPVFEKLPDRSFSYSNKLTNKPSSKLAPREDGRAWTHNTADLMPSRARASASMHARAVGSPITTNLSRNSAKETAMALRRSAVDLQADRRFTEDEERNHKTLTEEDWTTDERGPGIQEWMLWTLGMENGDETAAGPMPPGYNMKRKVAAWLDDNA